MNPSLFIHESSFSSFNHHHQTKYHHKQNCNRASYFEVIFCEKIVVRMKNVKFRRIPRGKDEFRGSNSAEKTQIPRLGSKFRGPRKTVGPTYLLLNLNHS